MIRFAKYHGCGNSFVIVREKDVRACDLCVLAEKMCSEHTGIGADGFMAVKTEPGLEMIFYNRDGSRAPMCGNGIRCFAKFCYDERICTDRQFPVETLAGRMIVEIAEESPFTVQINMGRPVFEPEACGIKGETDPYLKRTIEIEDADSAFYDGRDKNKARFEVSSIFMGTIHTVLWTDDLDKLNKEKTGSAISNHPVYTEKTNVDMVQYVNRKMIKMQTFERGAGMTLACGTGACASAVIAMTEGKCDDEIEVLLPLGSLHITKNSNGEIFMRGPAAKIADGVYEEE